MAGLAEYTLCQATPTQITEFWTRLYTGWKCKIPIDQHLSRFKEMSGREHAVNGKYTVWVLAPRSDQQTLKFVTSCATYKRNALFLRGPDADVEAVTGYSIASVNTPIEYRGKGYAKHMMRLLHYKFSPQSALPPFPSSWGPAPPKATVGGDAKFSVLFSAIGPHFYKLAGTGVDTDDGWIPRWTTETSWSADSSISKRITQTHDWEELDYCGCQAIWSLDAQLMKQDLKAKAGVSNGKCLVAFTPDHEVAATMIHRAIVYIPSFTSGEPWTVWGIRSDGAGTPSYATWSLDLNAPTLTLVVTRIRATSETLSGMLKHINEFALKQGIPTVAIWDMPPDLSVQAQAILGTSTEKMKETVPAIKWYGEENEIDWCFVEKFCWC